MHFQPGDYVYPTDIRRRVLCRVEQTETLPLPSGSIQFLRLVPLAGPWPQGTVLLRLCHAVAPASRELSAPVRDPDGRAGLPSDPTRPFHGD